MLKTFFYYDKALTLELRQGLTGNSVEINGVQIFWSENEQEAEGFLKKLSQAFGKL